MTHRPPRLPRPDADLTLWWEPLFLAGLLLVWAPVEVWRRHKEYAGGAVARGESGSGRVPG